MKRKADACKLCNDPAAAYPLPVAGTLPDGTRVERNTQVCVACVCLLTDAPSVTDAPKVTDPTVAYLAARRRFPGGDA